LHHCNHHGREAGLYGTGVKVAIGAHVNSKRIKEWNAGAKVGFDGTPLGAPIFASPKIEDSVEQSQEVELGGSSDYVFALSVEQA
jgi:hypothetical protein